MSDLKKEHSGKGKIGRDKWKKVSAGLSAGGSVVGMAKSWGAGLKETKLTNPIKSVGLKLLLIISASIIACVIAVGVLSYFEAKKLVEENVSEASLQTITQVANNLDTVFQNYSDLTMQIMIDKDIREHLQTYVTQTDEFDSLMASRDVAERLSNYIMGNNTIAGAAFIPTSPDTMPITAGLADSTVGKKVREAEWFKQVIEMDGREMWIEAQADGIVAAKDASSIALARLVKNIGMIDDTFVLVLEVPVERFVERYQDVNLGNGSKLFVVDAQNNTIINDDAALIGKAASVSLPADAETGRPKLNDADGNEVLAAYQTFKNAEWKLVGTIPVEELAKQASVIGNLTIWMGLLGAVIAVAIGLLVIATIAKPLVQLRNLMVEGARGNLTVRSNVRKRQDEIGQLADSFNEMMTQIQSLALQTTRSAAEVLATASDLTEASKQTSIAAKEIAVATEEIANGATSLAVEAEKGSDLTNHMNVQMKEVISANVEMSSSASEVEKASRQGTAYMGVLIEKTGTTEEMTRSMVEKVDALKDSTGSIVKILDVLNNLTKQTNILSLNATIEAARAGAAGKGFMVVADEIRKLADQSRQSIDVVAQITAKIQGEIEETVSVLSEAYPLFQEQITSVKEANSIFLKVEAQMGQFSDKLELATSAVNELEKSQAVMSDAMTSVSAVAEESSATSEEVASLSSEQLSISESLVRLSDKLDAVSRELKESLSKFKMD
ncbi:methyl-accepting chemotaxis protein [Paenibacillus sp. LHD-117]|uniref:methyl-accepting chemotaxis protein n=1 Tax=Paenibacillus sp. LHD-117 TaxID=3071412 RepID=UPI0027E1ACEB|nr:methyl-accepting chemotaxis protein [Paenibacillus sp. LHD-117]MDQ6418563.1 methyl-accepting chemotaxis protein [Paenibacillus sp. LHD-117]